MTRVTPSESGVGRIISLNSAKLLLPLSERCPAPKHRVPPPAELEAGTMAKVSGYFLNDREVGPPIEQQDDACH